MNIRHFRSLCVALTALAGCSYAPEELTASPPPLSSAAAAPGPQPPATLTDADPILDNVVHLIEGGQYGLAVANLNSYFAGTDSTAFTLQAPAREFLRARFSEDALQALEARPFTTRDARHLEDCILYQQVARRAAAGAGDDLTRVGRAWDWLVRHVQLVPAGALAAPGLTQVHARPYDVLMRGMAVEDEEWSERGWVFLALCRQMGLDAGLVTVTPPGLDHPVPWACAVLIERHLYLFDPRIGLPVPGPDGRGVATLDDALRDPSVLAQLDLPGESAYGVHRAALRASPIGVMIDSSPGYCSPRMRLLQDRLPGKDRVVLYRDPAEQRDRIAEALGRSGAVTLWEVPLTVATKLFTDPAFVEATQRAQPYFYPAFPLAAARARQLRGDLAGAVGEYMAFSLLDHATLTDKTTPMPADDQRALDIHATYFLGLCHLDQGNDRLAGFFFEKTLRLIPEPVGAAPSYVRFGTGARFNLGLLAAAGGDTPRAVACFTRPDPTRQERGNRLRARALIWRDPFARPAVDAGPLRPRGRAVTP